MRILVTGGAGFIGSHVAAQLLARGHEVAIVDNLSSGKRENVPGGARLYEGDIRFGCSDVFEEFKPEGVSHHAAQIDVRRSVREPDFDAEVNILGTIRLLEDCSRWGVVKVVFASTGGAIYGEQERFPASEDHPQYPSSPYGVSKLAAERYLNYYRIQHDLNCLALRYANVYGPGQDPHGEAGVVAIFCDNLVSGQASRINGGGEQTRDYVYVGDVARANVLAMENPVPSASYNIGTGVETSVNRLYELLQNLSGKDIPPRYGPGKPGEQLRSALGSTRATRVLGWRPEVNLASGLQSTLDYFENRRQQLYRGGPDRVT